MDDKKDHGNDVKPQVHMGKGGPLGPPSHIAAIAASSHEPIITEVCQSGDETVIVIVP